MKKTRFIQRNVLFLTCLVLFFVQCKSAKPRITNTPEFKFDAIGSLLDASLKGKVEVDVINEGDLGNIRVRAVVKQNGKEHQAEETVTLDKGEEAKVVLEYSFSLKDSRNAKLVSVAVDPVN